MINFYAIFNGARGHNEGIHAQWSSCFVGGSAEHHVESLDVFLT